MKLTKLLPLSARPAPALLARAKKIVLTYAQRVQLPKEVSCEGVTLEVALEQDRAIEVGDVFLDEKGMFYTVQADVDDLMIVTGDLQMLQEAALALTARGIRLAQAENGFAMIGSAQFKAMIESVGLKCEMVKAPFTPIPLPSPEEHHCGCGCGCGHHHHHHGECGCGHHHHEESEECACGHHHHEEDEGCCCGHHHHEEGEECGCGHHHHHEEGEECCCGHHHHEEGEECGCEHHHEDGEECCCGHHHHEEGEKCACGHHPHDESEQCCCGHHHH